METVVPFGLVGKQLDDRDVIESFVAEGGFGVVYRAQHRALKAQISVKLLKVPAEISELARRFIEEAQTIAKLLHLAIARVLAFGVSPMPAGGSAPWMVLDWLEGETFESHLDANRRMHGPQEGLQLPRPVLEGLAFAHEQGGVYRDIKPANIMLPLRGARRGRPSTFAVAGLLDFGISKAMACEDGSTSGETRTSPSMMAFSFGYAAPEQLGGLRTGPWTDVHAMALVIAEMLTCRCHPGPRDATPRDQRRGPRSTEMNFFADPPCCTLRVHGNAARKPAVRARPKITRWVSLVLQPEPQASSTLPCTHGARYRRFERDPG